MSKGTEKSRGSQNKCNGKIETYPQRRISPTTKKIRIEQSVDDSCRSDIPYYVKRAIDDPKNIVLERRPGEGSKPLFSRNKGAASENVREDLDERLHPLISSSSDSDSDIQLERRLQPSKRAASDARGRQPKSRTPDPKSHQRRKNKSFSPNEKLKPKIPYFVDALREEDRIRQKYESGNFGFGSRERSSYRKISCDSLSSKQRREHKNKSSTRPLAASKSDDRRRPRSRNHYCRENRNNIPCYRPPLSQPFIPVVPLDYTYHAWIPSSTVRYPPYMLRPWPRLMAPTPYIVPPPPFRPGVFHRFRSNYYK